MDHDIAYHNLQYITKKITFYRVINIISFKKKMIYTL